MDNNWIKINGLSPDPAPPINQPVLVVYCPHPSMKPFIELMAWTGEGWSTGVGGRWHDANQYGEGVLLWQPLPEIPDLSSYEFLTHIQGKTIGAA